MKDHRTASRIAVDDGIVSADLARSLRFYHRLLGLPIVAELNTTLIGTGRMIQLAHGESLIKLVELDDAPSMEGGGDIGRKTGYRYITLLIPDIITMMTKLTQHEVPVYIPITTLSSGTCIAMVKDPDGNIVELVQETS